MGNWISNLVYRLGVRNQRRQQRLESGLISKFHQQNGIYSRSFWNMIGQKAKKGFFISKESIFFFCRTLIYLLFTILHPICYKIYKRILSINLTCIPAKRYIYFFFFCSILIFPIHFVLLTTNLWKHFIILLSISRIKQITRQ